MQNRLSTPRIAIACGGTGGHLYPGVAVAEALKQRGCAVTLLISPKDVDQTAVQGLQDVGIVTIPAVGLTRGGGVQFLRGFFQSIKAVKKIFRGEPHAAVLAMGGFTSAPPVFAVKSMGMPAFLHESNTIPGRANRWLSWVVNRAFVGFPQASARMRARHVTFSGTPVRPQFQPQDKAACREAMGLDPSLPVLLVMGGSQGATGLNNLVIRTLPHLAKRRPDLQLIHLAGPNDVEKVREAAGAVRIQAVVHSFFRDMHIAMGAADAAISRAGASSLAEIAAMRLPSVLVPYPSAMDNHQFFNAQAFRDTGAALLMEQDSARTESLAERVMELIESRTTPMKMREGLQRWHFPEAAERIAEGILQTISTQRGSPFAPKTAAPGKIQNQQTAIT
jgi:UDP-N-acetylglucosamine--N-acetylmuramyl-(pentapeptide) pyrophosphoryl-undecaprenol N-acetylglucosamine transferase